MERPRKTLSAMVLLALAAVLVAVSPSPLRIDLDLRGAERHALINFGFATVKLAFDSGQGCSNSNGCEGLRL